jgi:signal transduction histidine kinase
MSNLSSSKDNLQMVKKFSGIRNVIINAIKYTPNGGQITIDGRMLPGFIETTISDTGIGIDPDDHIHIFEKFGRLGSVSLHSSGKIKYKGGGPGLGLPITKGIIEAHGIYMVESKDLMNLKCLAQLFISFSRSGSTTDDQGSELLLILINKT